MQNYRKAPKKEKPPSFTCFIINSFLSLTKELDPPAIPPYSSPNKPHTDIRMPLNSIWQVQFTWAHCWVSEIYLSPRHRATHRGKGKGTEKSLPEFSIVF